MMTGPPFVGRAISTMSAWLGFGPVMGGPS